MKTKKCMILLMKMWDGLDEEFEDDFEEYYEGDGAEFPNINRLMLIP